VKKTKKKQRRRKRRKKIFSNKRLEKARYRDLKKKRRERGRVQVDGRYGGFI
jgi:hypothetical protein